MIKWFGKPYIVATDICYFSIWFVFCFTNISGSSMQFSNLFQQESWDWAEYHKLDEMTKEIILQFDIHRFFRWNSFDFFKNWYCPRECKTVYYKVKQNKFYLGRYGLLHRMSWLEWAYCTLFGNWLLISIWAHQKLFGTLIIIWTNSILGYVITGVTIKHR